MSWPSGFTVAPKVASAPRGPGHCCFARYPDQSLPQAAFKRMLELETYNGGILLLGMWGVGLGSGIGISLRHGVRVERFKGLGGFWVWGAFKGLGFPFLGLMRYNSGFLKATVQLYPKKVAERPSGRRIFPHSKG